MTDPVVELSHVTKRFADVPAVHDLSFSIQHGEWLTLLGPSGCGKSTTLRLIAGFIRPDTGSIRLQGRDMTGLAPEKRGLGIVFQSYALFPHMTVFDNVAFGLRRRSLGKQAVHRRVAEALNLVRLTGLEARKPNQLSGGQQQRVALARALAIEPAALLLDEPLSNLDAALRDEMRVELRELQRRLGVATLFVTHDQEEALALSDRIAVMSAGACTQLGTPHEIYERPSSEFAARFMRFRNVLKGTVVERSGDWIDVKLRDGTSIRARAMPQSSTRGEVTVVVRPERILLTDAGGIPGTISEVTYLGEHVRCLAETEVGPLWVSVSAKQEPAIGQRVRISIPPSAAHEVTSE